MQVTRKHSFISRHCAAEALPNNVLTETFCAAPNGKKRVTGLGLGFDATTVPWSHPARDSCHRYRTRRARNNRPARHWMYRSGARLMFANSDVCLGLLTSVNTAVWSPATLRSAARKVSICAAGLLVDAVVDSVVLNIGCQRIVAKLLLECLAAGKLTFAYRRQGLLIDGSVILFCGAQRSSRQREQSQPHAKPGQRVSDADDGLTFAYVDGQHVTWRAVHDAIGRRPQ